MNDSYKGLTLDEGDYKIKIRCNDKQRQRAIEFLSKNPYPHIFKDMLEGSELLLKINEKSEEDYDDLNRLVQELAEC